MCLLCAYAPSAAELLSVFIHMNREKNFSVLREHDREFVAMSTTTSEPWSFDKHYASQSADRESQFTADLNPGVALLMVFSALVLFQILGCAFGNMFSKVFSKLEASSDAAGPTEQKKQSRKSR